MTNTAQESFAERLRQSRKECELTRAALSKKVGMPKGFIRGIENGKVYPPLDVVTEIARSLGVSPAWLAFGEVVEDRDWEAVQVARAWARLKEPERSAMKETIRRLADG